MSEALGLIAMGDVGGLRAQGNVADNCRNFVEGESSCPGDDLVDDPPD